MRPFFYDTEGRTRHWRRFDRFYRTRNLQMLWVVMDDETYARYVVLFLDAVMPYNSPKQEAIFEYKPGTDDLEAFNRACAYADNRQREESRSRFNSPRIRS